MENNILELDGIFKNGYGFIAKIVMQDNQLSLQAKGLYAYLCSYSGKGKDAFPSRKKMCFDLNITNDTLGKYLKELKESNYIQISQSKNESRFSNNIYKINLNLPCTKISDTENQDTNNNNFNNNKEKDIPSSKDEELRNHFELIWKEYPNKKGKSKAEGYYFGWLKGRKINSITRKITDEQMYYAVRKYAKECEENKIEQQFIKHGDTFFNSYILDYVE